MRLRRYWHTSAAFAFAFALACWMARGIALGAEPKDSHPGVYQGYSQAQYTDVVKTSQYVTVRDGTRLAVDIYRPAIKGKPVAKRFPVVWLHTPYRRAYVDRSGKIVTAIE